MSENDYVATAAAQKRLREVLAARMPHHTEALVEEIAVLLLDGAQIEYKSRAKQVVISLDLPDKATVEAARGQLSVTAAIDAQVEAEYELGAIPGEKCWCGGAVGRREPGDENGLGCLADISHNWQAASAESQAIIESETAPAPPIPRIVPFEPKQFAEPDFEDVHFD